jgi:acyl-coenzyme A thioesterase PaaI-like protein
MHALPATRSCFVCGKSNPLGLRLRFETDGNRVSSRFEFQPEHSGFRNLVHGGLISTVLDEVMVWACGVRTSRFAYCVELNVRFVRPVRPKEPILATGEFVLNRRNRIFEAAGTLKNAEGAVLASAIGTYFPVKEGEMQDVLGEFEWDPRALARQGSAKRGEMS